MKTMKTENTTPASVATRLTEREIEWLAAVAESGIEVEGNRPNTAAVLRDYMRLRKLVNAVKACVDVIHAKNCCGDDCGSIRELKRLLAEAEK